MNIQVRDQAGHLLTKVARLRLRALTLGAAAMMMGAAGPAPEYGPEVEARFIERCVQSPASPGSLQCQRVMERLQAEAGYEGFLELAAAADMDLSSSDEQRLAMAAP